MEDIAPSLERQLILRRFNKDHLKMEDSTGSQLNRIIGMGLRTDPDSGTTDVYTKMYPSYFRNLLQAFEVLPIASQFGLTPETAMALPVDRWYQIRKMALRIRETKAPEENKTETALLEIVKQLTIGNTGGEA